MSDTRLKLMEAIARKKAIEALYNGKLIKLAPHRCCQSNRTLRDVIAPPAANLGLFLQ